MGATVRSIEAGEGRVVLVVVAHADDVALFAGGTVAAWANAGWRIVVVGVTDAVGLGRLRRGVDGDGEPRRVRPGDGDPRSQRHRRIGLPHRHARRRLDRRTTRTRRPRGAHLPPYALVSFDLHHPEHFDDVSTHTNELLAPHGCFERWYFGRRVIEVTDVVDIDTTLDRKIAAACCHRTMMLNFFNQLRPQAHTGGWRITAVDDAIAAATSPRRCR